MTRPILKNRVYLYLTEFFAGMAVMAVPFLVLTDKFTFRDFFAALGQGDNVVHQGNQAQHRKDSTAQHRRATLANLERKPQSELHDKQRYKQLDRKNHSGLDVFMMVFRRRCFSSARCFSHSVNSLSTGCADT